MPNIRFSFMDQSDTEQAARVLSIAMLDSPLHIGVFLGNGENERFYGKFGSMVISTSDILGVENRYMLREPSAIGVV